MFRNVKLDIFALFAALTFLALLPAALAQPAQTGAPASAAATGEAQTPTPAGTPVSAPMLSENLVPALHQVQQAVGQIHLDHWKLSRQWKRQFQEDSNSIQNDLSSQLPGLLQTAQAAPQTLEPQLSVMHNVDALYDVLVRLGTAANLSGGKEDAALLADAMQQLEAARKASADQILNAATTQDQQVTAFRKQLAALQSAAHPAASNPHKIVVDNDLSSHPKHRKVVHRRKPSAPAPAPATPAQPATPAPH